MTRIGPPVRDSPRLSTSCEQPLFLHVEPSSWLLVTDLAPIHCLRETLNEIRTRHSLCNVLFYPPRTTNVTQPLDRSYFRDVKAFLRTSWASVVAKAVLANMNDYRMLKNLPGLETNLTSIEVSGRGGLR